MSDKKIYNGEDRRVDNYDRFCKSSFQRIEGNIHELNVEMGLVKNKLFNGLSDVPQNIKDVSKEVKGVQKLVLGILISLILGGGTGIAMWATRLTTMEMNVRTVLAQNQSIIEKYGVLKPECE